MKFSIFNQRKSGGTWHAAIRRGKHAAIASATGFSMALLAGTGAAFAQATSPAGGIGAQINSMSSEAINSGGEFGGMAMYIAALVCFIGGVWALWQSRMPQNRENGRVAMGMAGLVLCGLFATGGVWINKAAVTASGGTASVNDTPATVVFGGAGN
jgi:hypothetical protein